MSDSEPDVREQCELLYGRCRRLAKLLDRRIIEEDECFYNLITSLVYGPDECWGCCLDEFEGRAGALFSYARVFLEGSDFMPCPQIFIAGTASEEQVAKMQRELRPKYKNLFEVIERRAGTS